jgi:hypothetical protein
MDRSHPRIVQLLADISLDGLPAGGLPFRCCLSHRHFPLGAGHCSSVERPAIIDV